MKTKGFHSIRHSNVSLLKMTFVFVSAGGKIPAAISLHYIARKNSKMISIALLLITGYLSFHVLANLGYIPPTNPLSIIQK
jgi:hypothetical protein